MIVFFYNKDTLRKQLGTVGEEISRCRRSFTYIGYTMSDIIEQDLSDAIKRYIANRGIEFEFCILDEESESASLYAEYTGRDIGYIKASIKRAERAINLIQQQLPDDKRSCIKLFKHDKFIPSSCFLGDINEDYGWIHFNYKAPRSVKLQDFGFVVTKSVFYEHMKESYLTLLQDIYSYNKG